MVFFEVLVWFCFVLLGITYLGYPTLLKLLKIAGQGRGNDWHSSVPLEQVTLIISAHNEVAVIRDKLENSLALEAGAWKFRIIVADDYSDDGTGAVVASFEQAHPGLVSQVRADTWIGKNAALNLALEQVPGGVVVFSDANAFYRPDALLKLVRPFEDPSVGCTIGQLSLVQNGQTLEGAYWKWEHKIKQAESALGRMVVGNGSIIAARREALPHIFPGVSNDLHIPVASDAAGLKTLFIEDAQALEHVSTTSREEYDRKVRMAIQGLNHIPQIFRLSRGWMKVMFFFHKVMRWTTALFLVVAFALSLILAVVEQGWLWPVVAGLQVGFYALAPLGWYLERRGKKASMLGFPWYFCVMHAAGASAMLRTLRGNTMATWNKPESTRLSINVNEEDEQ